MLEERKLGKHKWASSCVVLPGCSGQLSWSWAFCPVSCVYCRFYCLYSIFVSVLSIIRLHFLFYFDSVVGSFTLVLIYASCVCCPVFHLSHSAEYCICVQTVAATPRKTKPVWQIFFGEHYLIDWRGVDETDVIWYLTHKHERVLMNVLTVVIKCHSVIYDTFNAKCHNSLNDT